MCLESWIEFQELCESQMDTTVNSMDVTGKFAIHFANAAGHHSPLNMGEPRPWEGTGKLCGVSEVVPHTVSRNHPCHVCCARRCVQ
jgi:hypothetical protein